MKIVTDGIVRGFDSNTYRRIFEFAQEEGIEPFLTLFDETNDRVLERVLKGQTYPKHGESRLSPKSELALEFLRQFKGFFLHDLFDTHINQNVFRNFRGVVEKTANNINDLSIYTENAKRLEGLRVCRIDFGGIQFGDFRTQVWSKAGHIETIRKHFTDGIIAYTPIEHGGSAENRYEEFHTRISNNPSIESSPTWEIEAENHENGQQYRYAIIEDFGFNGEQMPTEEELREYDEPKSLKMYREKGKN